MRWNLFTLVLLKLFVFCPKSTKVEQRLTLNTSLIVVQYLFLLIVLVSKVSNRRLQLSDFLLKKAFETLASDTANVEDSGYFRLTI